MRLAKGDRLSIERLTGALIGMGFTRDDFVWAPGQYSVRGGIIDIFSYGDIHPYRIDLFGDEIDSIRLFDINTQLSTESREAVEVVANISSGGGRRICFTDLLKSRPDRRYWVVTPSHVERRLNEIRTQTVAGRGDEGKALLDSLCSGPQLCRSLMGERVIALHGTFSDMTPGGEITARKSPQTPIGKNFELLRGDLAKHKGDGYAN